MSRKSETALLREELARMAVENRELREMVSRLEAASSRRIAALAAENDRLRLEIAERDRRMGKYENAHAPSLTGSLYNEKRAAFRKMMAEDGYADEDGDGGGPEPGGDGDGGKAEGEPSRRGPPAGHVGASHSNKAGRTVVLRVHRCGTCGRGHLRKLPPVVKMVYDFAGGNSMMVECVAYVMRRGSCKRCGGITTAAAPAISGTSFGPGILGFIEEYYAGRCTDQTISYFFDALYGFAVTQNAVWNARKAIRDLLEGAYREILCHIAEAPFVQLDESPIRMNGRQGYVWLATIRDATYIVAASSRAAAVLDIHFSRILDVPAVSDGYVVYNMLPVRQRCWVHLLREAEECAVRNGGSNTSCYFRLLSIYRAIKGRESADSSECIALERAVLEIASSYPEGHKFRIKLEGAAPYLFTFLRHPGMPPHNNGAELEIRDTAVLHRNV
ncbi:MAG: transposase, partial [Thaumarchaeota archaeon]|nr:transposase [Nitrososphaerota archaeon]